MRRERGGVLGTLVLPVVLVALVAALVLGRGIRTASDLTTVPDEVEYAIGAVRLVTNGTFDIPVAGDWVPPRYAPWFSLLILAPAYLVLGPELGNGILPVTFLSVVGVVAAFLIGRRISGAWGGLFAAAYLLVLPEYRDASVRVMTDGPCTALALVQCLLYLRIRSRKIPRPAQFLLPALVGAICAALRPVFVTTLLPFLLLALRRGERRSVPGALVVVSAAVAVVSAGMVYNAVHFGSPLRSGYGYWMSLPYDYAQLTLSPAYLGDNLAVLWRGGLARHLLLAGLLYAAARVLFGWTGNDGRTGAPRPLRLTALYTVLMATPVVLLHLVYFFPSGRFFLPASALLVVVASGAAGLWAQRVRLPREVPALLLALTVALALRWRAPDPAPTRREAVERIARHTPQDALIVSALDPAYLEWFTCRDTARRVLPVSRRVEYASKVVMPTKSGGAPPTRADWPHHREWLLARGGTDPFPAVALDDPERIVEALQAGTPVYLDVSHVRPEDRDAVESLRIAFDGVRRAEDLYEFRLP